MRNLTSRTLTKNNLPSYVCSHTWMRERKMNCMYTLKKWKLLFSLFHICFPFFLCSICNVVLVAQLRLTFDSRDCSPPGSSVHGILQTRMLEGIPFPSPGIFLTQVLNLGLPHCRQILYHLSHLQSLNICSSIVFYFLVVPCDM